MHFRALAATAVVASFATGAAHAEAPPPPGTKAAQPAPPPAPPEEPATHVRVDGELQLRLRGQTRFLLPPTPSRDHAVPGVLVADSTGLGQFFWGYARLSGRIEVGKQLALVVAGDGVVDTMLGNVSRGVLAERTPRAATKFDFKPRALYLDARLDDFDVMLGHMPVHWGEGMIWNSGTTAPLFGDYRGGDIFERLQIQTKPVGDISLVLGYAQDFVFQDAESTLADGDTAVAVSGFVRGDTAQNHLGVLLNYKTHTSGTDARVPFGDKLNRFTVDVTGSADREASFVRGFARLAFEGAAAWGDVSTRTATGVRVQSETLRTYGFVARAEIHALAYEAADEELAKKLHPARYPCDPACRRDLTHAGRIEGSVEVGYASGDSSPENGVYSRFVFDQNHRVGLILFDEALRAISARAATIASDPIVPAAARPNLSPNLYPTNGGVAGALYLYPTLVYRPLPALDVRVGAVKAQTTASPPDGSRDLGLELDLGVEGRIPLGFRTHVALGAEGAALFPGAALGLNTLWLGQLRAGYVF